MPGPPYSADRVAGRIIMVRCGETQNSGHGVLCGTRDEELTILGDVQAQKAAELLMDVRVSAPRRHCAASARDLAGWADRL